MYDSLGPEAVEHILGHSDMEGVLVAAPCLPRMLQATRKVPGHALKFVCCWGPAPEELLVEVGPHEEGSRGGGGGGWPFARLDVAA